MGLARGRQEEVCGVRGDVPPDASAVVYPATGPFRFLWRAYNAVVDPFSKTNALGRIYGLALVPISQWTRRTAMIDGAFRFSTSAIAELNRQPGTGPLPKRQFALLLVGLAAVVLLLYAQIVW
jgi:hypothetical protein